MSPTEVSRVARHAGRVTVGTSIDKIGAAASTRIRATAPPVVHARLRSGIRPKSDDLTPTLHATLKHATSMTNPLFSERQRLRKSTWDTPRFLRSYDETLDDRLVLPRGLQHTVGIAGRAGR